VVRALSDAARTSERDAAATLFEELSNLYDELDQPVDAITAMEAVIERAPKVVAHHERLASLYQRAGAWVQAAVTLETAGNLAASDRGRAALHAAAALYHQHGRLDSAAAVYRTLVQRRSSDVEAWKALDQLLEALGRWDELAVVRGQLADLAAGGLEKAEGGNLPAAADLVAQASQHAPERISILVDHADALARAGKPREAADVLAARVEDAIARRASPNDIAALRLRLVTVLEESCRDRAEITRRQPRCSSSC
jgi:thioredoxin-like negative regulator of GroEL